MCAGKVNRHFKAATSALGWEASHVAYPYLDMLYHLWQKTLHVTGAWHCPSRAVGLD